MKNKLLMLVGAMAFAAAGTVQATMISGEIDMSGTATLDSTSLGLASQATALTGVKVGGTPTGSFSTVTSGDSVTWNPFSFSGGSATPLWTFTDAGTGWTYTFDLTSDYIKSQDNYFLNVLGSGTLSITGTGSPYVSTPGAWSFTISNPTGGSHANFDFTFANSQTAVPDGGATVMLLGAVLSGLGLLRKKLLA